MNTIQYKSKIFAVTAAVMLLAACADFTDIQPKGVSTLDRVEELEMLLNHRSTFDMRPEAPAILINDLVPDGDGNRVNQLMDDFLAGRPSQNAIMTLWDWNGAENFDRTQTTDRINGEQTFTRFFHIINRVSNPIIANIDNATGDRRLAEQIRAEALVLRAYAHYKVVNFHARAYNPATAATDGGIPFATEDYDMSRPIEKRTVREVYDLILADLAAADFSALPEVPHNMRVGRAFAYAVEAKVLMSLHRHAEARRAAENSLAVNNQLLDHRADTRFVPPMPPFRPEPQNIPYFRRERYNVEDLFGAYDQRNGRVLSNDLVQSFEENDIFRRYGDLEFNISFPMTFLMNSAQSSTNIVGAQGMWSDFFAGNPFTAAYSGLGLTTVDMWLTLAECMIREGDAAGAAQILNTLRERRTVSGYFVPIGTDNIIEDLKRVSRNENFLTSQNFINLKRWNTERGSAWETTLTKTLEISPMGFAPGAMAPPPPAPAPTTPSPPLGATETHTFTLRPNSPLWIFPFPQSATDFNPYLTQNYM